MMSFDELVAGVRRAAADDHPAPPDFAAWRAGFACRGTPFQAAVAAGLSAGQLAFCFAGGYQAALRCLLPSLPATAFGALLLSEGKRQRPEELTTTLTPRGDGGFRLEGEKSWVTGALSADPLLVIARRGTDADGRVSAALVVLPPGLDGIRIEERRDMPFLAAVPHGRALFTGVEVEAAMVVEGDGWRDHARPFRTIEDVHVLAAMAAHAARQSVRDGWSPSLQAALLSCLARLSGCAQYAPGDPSGHLLLAAAERELQGCVAQINELLAGRDDDFPRDWRANHLLVALAAPARAKRLEKAVATLLAVPVSRP